MIVTYKGRIYKRQKKKKSFPTFYVLIFDRVNEDGSVTRLYGTKKGCVFFSEHLEDAKTYRDVNNIREALKRAELKSHPNEYRANNYWYPAVEFKALKVEKVLVAQSDPIKIFKEVNQDPDTADV